MGRSHDQGTNSQTSAMARPARNVQLVGVLGLHESEIITGRSDEVLSLASCVKSLPTGGALLSIPSCLRVNRAPGSQTTSEKRHLAF